MASEGGGGGFGSPGEEGGAGGGPGGAIFFRRKDFKKTISTAEARQKRTETNIQIRKNKRLESLNKKRNVGGAADAGAVGGLAAVAAAEESGHAGGLTGSTGAAPLTTVPNEVLLDHLPVFAAAAMSDNPIAQYEGTKQIRRLLSKETDPPVVPVLRSEVVPVLADFLGRLENPALQFEAAWALTNIASTEHTEVIVDLGITPLLIRLLRSTNPDVREQCCWCLGNIAGDGHRFRDMVLDQEDAINNLVLNIAHPSSLSMLRNATWTLSNFCRGKPQPSIEAAQEMLPVLVHLLNSTDAEVLTDTCWALSYLSDGDDERIQQVIDFRAVPRLVMLMSHESTAVVNPALRAVGNIVTGNDEQTQAVIECGALHSFVPLMQSSKKNIRKEACWAVSNVAAGVIEQVEALTTVPHLIEQVIDLLGHGEWKVRKEAAWAVSNMTITGNETHIERLVNAGAIPPLCELLMVADTKIMLVAMDALDAVLKAGIVTNMPWRDLVEEAGGLERLYQLQEHKTKEVWEKAVSILRRHFPEDDETGEDGYGAVAPEMTTGEDGAVTYGFGLGGEIGNHNIHYG
uniref:Importin subunit alpha n=1 Tax=Bicosoecida sp. CB-2014 TaxID=1486930 RepID=A0A7S1C5A7_9STRA|mmetsp:Transcript_14330/g.49820  ORF Transcript_14330/g.49820 Transcript_14330/m.49820 type:complete len:573 (+) Transcript_14330:476-2194(+)